MAKTRPEDLPAGVRRLAEIIRAPVRYYPSEQEAVRAWAKIVQKFHYTLEQSEAAVKVSFNRKSIDSALDPVWWISCRIHKGCPHWRRFLEDDGVQCEMDDGTLNWPVIPPRTMEEILNMPKGTGGRWLP